MQNYYGVVCSKEKKEVYCLKESHEYKTKFQNRKDIDIVYLKFYDISDLRLQKLDVSKWNIEDVLKLEAKNISS